jgi:outer membrane protein insertion porin family
VTDDITFAVQGMGGLTAIGDVPQFNQFRMGGTNSVRGFQEGALGTGQHFLQSSAELRTKVPFLRKFKKYPIYDMTQLALFADAGQLFDRSSLNDNFGRPGYGGSIGTGLRLNLPFLGPIRVDYAVPVMGKGNINNFNFGVGQRF